ncbi:glycosyltransferase [Phreatobacter aquaticus]|uniref:Glycosyltransferase n=1 Tax=Phreatobacter aquaticus TaxID=2570229 RepID=A0A4D7QL41_9HYPH|nr:glycosyltransferase [Phreatobacter aquaticus]QCK87805.1 glycosyltransferase [Phreatobacter aquaticus]
MTRPRLLFLAPTSPSPDGNGLAMRIFLFLSAYAGAFDVDLAVVPVGGAPRVDPRAAGLCRRSTLVELSSVDSHFSLIASLRQPADRLAAFAGYANPSMIAPLTVAVRDAVKAFAGSERYDLIHVSRTYLAGLADLPLAGGPVPIVVDCDEAESAVHRALARLQRRSGKHHAAQWSMAEAVQFDKQARRDLPSASLCFAASAREATRLGAFLPGVPVETVGNPAPAPAAMTGRPHARHRGRERVIVAVGTMSYLPNSEGIIWFARQILPRIQARSRQPVRLVIVGMSPPDAVRRLAALSGVTVTGTVPDVAPYYRDADLVVAPLRAGGGTRIKLLEAAGHGRPAVSTRIGAEGLGLRHGRDLLIADTPQDFASACLAVLDRPDLARRLVVNARQAVRRDHDARLLRTRILSLVQPLVSA